MEQTSRLKETEYKKTEYKETLSDIFAWFPRFEYTKAQNARLIKFHAYNKHVKKIINYAAKFDQLKLNKICLVYVVGDVSPERVQKLLSEAGCSDRVCVLVSGFPNEYLDFYLKEFEPLKTKMLQRSHWDEDADDLNENFWHEFDLFSRALQFNELDQADISGQLGLDAFQIADERVIASERKLVLELKQIRDTVQRFHAIGKKAPAYFKTFKLHRAGLAPKTFRHADIDRLIVKTYPQGTEANQINTYAALSAASFQKGIELAKNGIQNRQLRFEINTRSKIIKETHTFIRERLSEKGYVEMKDLRRFWQSPPYGLAYNGYSAAYAAYALKTYPETLIYFDGFASFKNRSITYAAEDVALSDWDVYTWRRLSNYTLCIYTEYPEHDIVKRTLEALYGISADLGGHEHVVMARCEIEKRFSFPLFCTDTLLYKLTGPEMRWYDHELIKGYAQEIEAVGIPELRKRLKYHQTLAEILEQDGIRAPASAGWVWGRVEEIDYPDVLRLFQTTAESNKLNDLYVARNKTYSALRYSETEEQELALREEFKIKDSQYKAYLDELKSITQERFDEKKSEAHLRMV